MSVVCKRHIYTPRPHQSYAKPPTCPQIRPRRVPNSGYMGFSPRGRAGWTNSTHVVPWVSPDLPWRSVQTCGGSIAWRFCANSPRVSFFLCWLLLVAMPWHLLLALRAYRPWWIWIQIVGRKYWGPPAEPWWSLCCGCLENYPWSRLKPVVCGRWRHFFIVVQ